MTWHVFPVALDEPSLTIQHEPLSPLPLLLLLIEYSIDAKLVSLDSCLLIFVCTMSKNLNMYVLIDDVI